MKTQPIASARRPYALAVTLLITLGALLFLLGRWSAHCTAEPHPDSRIDWPTKN